MNTKTSYPSKTPHYIFTLWILLFLLISFTNVAASESANLCERNPIILYGNQTGAKLDTQKLQIKIGRILQDLSTKCFEDKFRNLEGEFAKLKKIPDEKLTLGDAEHALRTLTEPVKDLLKTTELRHPTSFVADSDESGIIAERIKKELNLALESLAHLSPGRDKPDNLEKTYWKYEAGTSYTIGKATFDKKSNSLSERNYMQYIADKCGTVENESNPKPSEQCADRFYEVHDTFYVARTITALINGSSGIKAKIAKLNVLQTAAEWRYYFNEARVLYPWELASQMGDIIKANDGRGFLNAPKEQTFWLHPTAALEYVPDAYDGQQFHPVIILELWGKNWWDFEKYDAHNDKMVQKGWAKGISFIATYSDVADVNDWGIGLSAHINHEYTTSITYRGDDNLAVMFSVDLLNLYKDSWKPAINKYKSIVKNPKEIIKH